MTVHAVRVGASSEPAQAKTEAVLALLGPDTMPGVRPSLLLAARRALLLAQQSTFKADELLERATDAGAAKQVQQPDSSPTLLQRADDKLVALLMSSLRLRKAIFVFPYLLCAAITAGCVYYIIAFGVKFENQQSGYWLQSNILSFLLDGIVIDPIRCFVLTSILSLFCGRIAPGEFVRRATTLF
jgi:hypothetical protein